MYNKNETILALRRGSIVTNEDSSGVCALSSKYQADFCYNFLHLFCCDLPALLRLSSKKIKVKVFRTSTLGFTALQCGIPTLGPPSRGAPC